jgi:hypothetical protein
MLLACGSQDDKKAPSIDCGSPGDGAMLDTAPGSSVTFGGSVTGPRDIASVTVNGAAATVSGTTFSANITTRFGINFADVVVTDTKGASSTRVCSFLVADQWAPESGLYADTIDLALTQSAIDEGGDHTGGGHSLADEFVAGLNSPSLQGQALQTQINAALPVVNPVVPETCDQPICPPVPIPGVACGCAYGAGINFLGLSLPGPQAVSLKLVDGGINVTLTVPNVGLNLEVFGAVGPVPFNLSGWVTASRLSVTMTVDASISNGKFHLSLRPNSVSGSVGAVTTAIPGLDGWIIDHVVVPFAQGYIKNLVSTTIASYITGNAIDPGLHYVISGLILSPFGTSQVPALASSGTPLPIAFNFGLTSASITPSRMLIGIASKFSAPAAQALPSLGIAIPDGTVLDDIDVNPNNAGVADHVGVLNQALHAAWRGGMFNTTVTGADFGNGLLPAAATIQLTAQLPPVADLIGSSVELSFGGLQLQVTDPGLANGHPLDVELGARLTSTPAFDGNHLQLQNVTVSELHFSTGEVTLDATSNQALQVLLGNLTQQLAIASVDGLPALPVPSLVVPPDLGANVSLQLGPTNLSLGYDANDFVLRGQIGPIVTSAGSSSDSGSSSNVGTGGPLPVGLYSWSEIETYEPQVRSLGESIHRLAGPLTDDVWAATLRLGPKVMYTLDPYTDVPGLLGHIDNVLDRYGPGGTYWTDNPTALNQPIEAIEVLNEPNFLSIPPETYGSLLVAAYAHIKAKWPGVIVVGMSCGDSGAAAGSWMEQVFAANPAVVTSMDVFSFHPYTVATAPDQDMLQQPFGHTIPDHIANLRGIAAAAGMSPSIPFWITEVGYQIDSSEGGLYPGNPGTVTLAEQAAYNIRFDVLALRKNIARVYHMFTDDTDFYNGGYFHNGDGVDRPAATATRQLISLLNGYTSLEAISEHYGTGQPFVYRFHTPGKTVIVAWAQTPQTIPIAITGTTVVTDMLGHVLATTTQSSYSAALSENPIFLTSH